MNQTYLINLILQAILYNFTFNNNLNENKEKISVIHIYNPLKGNVY